MSSSPSEATSSEPSLQQLWLRRCLVAAPYLLLGLSCLFVIYVGYPGILTWDGFFQLVEARSGTYTDAHPPVFSHLWHYIDKIVAGPAPMLVINVVGFAAGLYWIARKRFAPLQAAIVASGVMLFPPVMTPMIVVWKDSLMAAMLIIGIGGLLTQRWWATVIAFVTMVIAAAVRYNAPAAVLPLCAVLFFVPELRERFRWQRYVVAVAAGFTCVASALSWNSAITDRKIYLWHSSIAIMDIVGTMVESDMPRDDAAMREMWAGIPLLKNENIYNSIVAGYRDDDYSELIRGEHAMFALSDSDPATPEQRQAIERTFWRTITSYPGAYAKFRLRLFRNVIGLTSGRPKMRFVGHYQQVEWLPTQGITWQPTEWQVRIEKTLKWMSIRFRVLWFPWLYLLTAFAIGGLMWWKRAFRDRTVFALIASGVGMESSLLVAAPTPDYRYSHWLVVTTVLAMVMVGHTWWRGRRGKGARAQSDERVS